MHIQERITTLTTCTKMTEEVDRRHGMNGNSSSKGISGDNSVQSSAPPSSATSAGGRLKFFKDGKFILELARAGEGERVGWVSVPRKTFWPPTPSGPPAPATPSTPSTHSTLSARQERATSLSVSDDNSSVQSSPWQRDHCWKQTSPRRGLSKELCMLYVRPSSLPSRLLRCPSARRKRRRPLDPAPLPSPPPSLPNGDTEKPTALGKFKFLRNKSDSSSEPAVLRVYKKTKKRTNRREIGKIIDSLKEKLPPQFAPVNAKLSALNCKQEPFMVSPRKRILRELERVSLEDQANKKSRARRTPPAPQPGPSCAPDAPKLYNGSSHARPPAPSKPVSSYSIVSILSIPEDAPAGSPDGHSGKKASSYSSSKVESPHSYSSVKAESPLSTHSPDSLPRRPQAYACPKLDSPLGMHSPDSHSLKSSRNAYAYMKTESPASAPSPDPSPSPEHFRQGRQPYLPPRPPELVDYYYGDRYNMYQGGFLPHNPYLAMYPSFPPARAPLGYGLYAPPTGPWAALAHPHPLLTDHTPREDTSSDVPLNLSKH